MHASSNKTKQTSLATYDLPGIDIDAGLKVVMGNEALYRRLLKKFTDSQGQFDKEFNQALQIDKATAATVAHTLKGTAGNLGMQELYASAQRLEQSCREQADNIDTCLQDTLRNLNTVLVGLRTGLSED